MSTAYEQPQRPGEQREVTAAEVLLASSVPCALIDQAGMVADASPPLRAMVPDIVGRSLDDAFQVEREALTGNDAGIPGIYVNAAGELVPAVLQLANRIHIMDGRQLLFVLDGAPFRAAEAQRFNAAPFTVIRATSQGVIRFVNRLAAETLRRSPKTLRGMRLEAVFAAEAAQIQTALENCREGRSAAPVEVTVKRDDGDPEPLRLLMMPDLAPDDRQLGIVAIVQKLAIERTREAIMKVALDSTITDWRQRLRKIFALLRPVIDFDHALFGMYGENATLFRAFYMEPDDFKWPSRWLYLPPTIAAWLEKGETWVPSIEEFVESEPYWKFQEVTKLYAGQGIVSSVTLVVRRAHGFTSALSLCSKVKERYGPRDLELLRELGLEAVMIRLESEISLEREKFWNKLKREIETADALIDAGQSIVDQVAHEFEWDHVSLFRVNRRKRRFELIAQPQKSPPEYKLPPGHTQPLKKGMLGRALRTRQTLHIDDFLSQEENKHEFEPVNSNFRSALTMPIYLNGRIRWMANAEHTESHAFAKPDRVMLAKIVSAIERGLAQRLLNEVKSGLLNESEQGIVLVGLEGAILEMNSVAARLLDRNGVKVDCNARPIYLARYGADKLSRDTLRGRLPTSARRVMLRGRNGKASAVLATRRDLPEGYDLSIWFMVDLESRDWSRELRFLRETVADVAQQTRVPLTIASTLAQQLPSVSMSARQDNDAASSDKIDQICSRLAAEVRKVDITFERLAEGLQIAKEPVRSREEVDLSACLKRIIGFLPEGDQGHVKKDLPQQGPIISGDAERLGFVVRSLVAHLLRCRPDNDTKVQVQLVAKNDRAVIKLGLTEHRAKLQAEDSAPQDVLWHAFRSAHEDASLALSAITAVVAAHGGKLVKRAPDKSVAEHPVPWTAFDIVLPQIARAGVLQ